jgi:hypothetical protein
MTQRPTSGRPAGADQTVTAAGHVDLDDVLGRAAARAAGATGAPAAVGTTLDGAIDRCGWRPRRDHGTRDEPANRLSFDG